MATRLTCNGANLGCAIWHSPEPSFMAESAEKAEKTKEKLCALRVSAVR
jgi:hypothetical protein